MKKSCTRKALKQKWRKTKKDARNGFGIREKKFIGPIINKICKKGKQFDDSFEEIEELKPQEAKYKVKGDSENSIPSTTILIHSASTPTT